MEQLGRLTDSLQTLVEQTIAPALAGIAEQIAALQELLGTGPVAKPAADADDGYRRTSQDRGPRPTRPAARVRGRMARPNPAGASAWPGSSTTCST